MSAVAVSIVLLVLDHVGVDGDMYGFSFMGSRISAIFLANHSLPCLGTLCKKALIAGYGFAYAVV